MSAYANIVFPGRHHLLTNFQHLYLHSLTKKAGGRIKTLSGKSVNLDKKLCIAWIITSANRSNTRRNPISGSKREAMIERFSEDLPAESFIFSVNDLGESERFADHIIKEVEVQSRGQLTLSPKDTLVACSTPEVISQYQQLGYEILPVELTQEEPPQYSHLRPWDLQKIIARSGRNWRTNERYLENIHPACQAVIEKYNYGDLIIDLYKDPLVGDEGDITETRNYESYRKAFEDGAERKYALIKDYVKNGRIVDIGCATGSIIKQLSADDRLRESDLYGIEVARALYDICEQRRANGDFPNENVFFYQRNITRDAIFPASSINTTLTFSLTHEIESYLGRDQLLKLVKQIYQQTAPGGIYINVDVVGPLHKDRTVLARLNSKDGLARDAQRYQFAVANNSLKDYLDGLSTMARFEQFAEDFRKDEGETLSWNLRKINNETFVETSLESMAEFMSKKDYTDNWQSEMHERFCFWSLDDWKAALTKVGFKVSVDSHTQLNPWIVDNRYKNKVEILRKSGTELHTIDYPPTTVILFAEKI